MSTQANKLPDDILKELRLDSSRASDAVDSVAKRLAGLQEELAECALQELNLALDRFVAGHQEVNDICTLAKAAEQYRDLIDLHAASHDPNAIVEVLKPYISSQTCWGVIDGENYCEKIIVLRKSR